MNLRSYVSLEMTFCWGSLPPWQSTIGDCHNWKELSVAQKHVIFNNAALRIRLNLLPHRSKACREVFVPETFKFRWHHTEGLPNSFRRHSACGNFSRKKKLLKNQLGTAVPPGMWFLIQQGCRPLVMRHLVCHDGSLARMVIFLHFVTATNTFLVKHWYYRSTRVSLRSEYELLGAHQDSSWGNGVSCSPSTKYKQFEL